MHLLKNKSCGSGPCPRQTDKRMSPKINANGNKSIDLICVMYMDVRMPRAQDAQERRICVHLRTSAFDQAVADMARSYSLK